MNYVRQFGIILAVVFVAELVRWLLPLSVPASIYGLVLMLLLLKTGAIKLGQVQEAGAFLVEIMPLLFVPAAVGLLDAVDALQGFALRALVLVLVTTVVVIGVTGAVAQRILRWEEERSQ